MGFEHAGLDFWLSSVACHCPDAPVIIVGTQLDQVRVLSLVNYCLDCIYIIFTHVKMVFGVF